jgi:NADH dehydrogenase
MTTDIVIVGGGYVGVWTARKIVRAVRRGSLREVRIRLVSDSTHHAFHGWTAEVLTGHVRLENARVPLSLLLPGVELVRGSVEAVDLAAQTVTVKMDAATRALSYDQLVLGVGSRDAVERVPGLHEHGWSLKHDDGLTALDAHVGRIAARASAERDPAERARLATVVVAGGGFTGVEAAAAVAQRLRRDTADRPVDPEPRVVLIHSGGQALPALRPRFDSVADYAALQAVRAGVDVRGGRRLTTVTAAGAHLDGDEFIPSATVISALGQTPVTLPGTESLPRDPAGRLRTDRFLRVATGVWAGGDVAAVPRASGQDCPANALWAIYHGKRIGTNIVRTLRGRAPAPFRFPGLGQGASLGVGRGAAELYGVPLTGWVAWIARWGFFHWFMPSRRIALATATEWFRPRSPRVAVKASGVEAELVPAGAVG